ncbi:MAG: Crp/Fnr family transcriptional regulator [Tannerellaceae bacterium]|nr:Crp/Fnr family transcriptional regulator [Tannerellaceae bacterium]
MESFNEYCDVVDFSAFTDFILKEGKEIKLKRKEYFGHQDSIARYGAYIKKGAVRYTRFDEEGKEHIVGYAFENDFACDLPSFIHDKPGLVNIQAIQDCILYVISHTQLNHYIEDVEGGEYMYRRIIEEYATAMYKRLLSFYCETPEQRYMQLLQDRPNLMKMIPLKEIASFIGVTPETLSHIRARFKKDEKKSGLL